MKGIFFVCLMIFGIFTGGYSFAANKKTYPNLFNSKQLRENLAEEKKALAKINHIRKKHGLRCLKNWTQLSNCAREHSQNMASQKCPFGHDAFEQRAEHMQQLAYLSSFGENVAYCYHFEDPVQTSIEGWMKSPSHRENILGDFEETGIGVAISQEGKFYITQLFAKRYQPNNKN